MTSFEEKIEKIKLLFSTCKPSKEKYQKVIELGRAVKPVPDYLRTEKNIVQGCQNITYLHTELLDNKLYFTISTDALISSGLAALLIMLYNGESPETVVKCKPTIFKELGIVSMLTPNRSNVISSLYLRMQQDALKFLVP